MYYNIKRRNLPHLYFNDGTYFITSRLAGTIPLDKLRSLSIAGKYKNEMSFEDFKDHFSAYDSFLDVNTENKQILNNSNVADILAECIKFPDGKDYRLICYTIMPTHFHFAFELLANNKGISKIMQSIKGNSSRKINKYLNTEGRLWQDESYDRLVRDDKELYFVIRYILLNSVKAGLVKNWYEWKNTYCRPNYIIL